MSKYSTTKHQYSIDVMRTTDNHACGFMAKSVGFEGDLVDSSGNVIQAGAGWIESDYNWDTELQRVFEEVDTDLKTTIENHFTDSCKAAYVNYIKGS
tara:strand:- start:10 stop:300 length:291 start_codon:yes stop_codon:yes gene_type:complete